MVAAWLIVTRPAVSARKPGMIVPEAGPVRGRSAWRLASNCQLRPLFRGQKKTRRRSAGSRCRREP